MVGKWVVNGDDNDLVDFLFLDQFVQVVDVTWDVADGTGWREGSWSTSDDDLLVFRDQLGPFNGLWHLTRFAVSIALADGNVLEFEVTGWELLVN